tara:strand:+ start:159 stop:323 length:165 start_codon:yes stop_codon:yes gene_type:complete
MPMGPGTYGSKVGRPRASYKIGGLVAARKTKTMAKKKPAKSKMASTTKRRRTYG